MIIFKYPALFTMGWFLFWNSVWLSFFLFVETSVKTQTWLKRIHHSNLPPRSSGEIMEELKSNGIVALCVGLPTMYVTLNYGNFFPVYEGGIIPPLPTLAKEFALWIIVEECIFYWVHRFMHIPVLYKWFHKSHHKPIREPYSLSGLINDPLDASVFLLVTLSGALLLNTHFFTLWCRIPWIAWLSFYSHSNLVFKYDPFGYLPSWLYFDHPGVHLKHHLDPRKNYGMHTQVWDILMKTRT
jgi:sterol desaturase/sphingolipid hydroxylase (fatty acid hydroxylase superfamily)